MRSGLTPTSLVLMTGAAMALELPVAGSYGTAEGCAKAAQQPTTTSGDTLAVTQKEVYQGAELCFYTGVTQTGTDAAAPAWTVAVTCPIGHEDEAQVTYTITERPAEKLLSVEVVSGPGVGGELEFCPVQPAP